MCKKVQGQSEAVIIDRMFDITLRPRSLEYHHMILTMAIAG